MQAATNIDFENATVIKGNVGTSESENFLGSLSVVKVVCEETSRAADGSKAAEMPSQVEKEVRKNEREEVKNERKEMPHNGIKDICISTEPASPVNQNKEDGIEKSKGAREKPGNPLVPAPTDKTITENVGLDVGGKLEQISSITFQERSKETIKNVKDGTSIEDEIPIESNLESSFARKIEDRYLQKVDKPGAIKEISKTASEAIAKESQIEVQNPNKALNNIVTESSCRSMASKDDENPKPEVDGSFMKHEEKLHREGEELVPMEASTREYNDDEGFKVVEGEDNIEAEKHGKKETSKYEEHLQQSFLQKNEPGRENLESPLNLAYDGIETTASGEQAETITHVEEQRPIESHEEILEETRMDKTINAENIKKNENREEKLQTISTIDLNEKTISAVVEIPEKNANDLHVTNPQVGETVQVGGEKQGKVSSSDLEEQAYEVNAVPTEKEKQYNEAHEASKSTERTNLEHKATEEAPEAYGRVKDSEANIKEEIKQKEEASDTELQRIAVKNEIKEEIGEVPEKISTPQIQDVVEAVTVGDITPDQALPAIDQELLVEVERADETEKIKEQIIDEESRNKELYVIPMADEAVKEVKDTEQEPTGSLEATNSNENTETIRFLEDLNWEAKPLEEEIGTSSGKPLEVTSSVSEEENIAVVGACNEKTDTAPTQVMEDVSSREVHPDDESLKPFDPSSEMENPEITETSPQGKEADSVMLEETSGMVSPLPTIKHENADKKSEKLKNSDADEEDGIKHEEPKSSDLVSETKDLQSGTSLIVGTTDTDEIEEEIKEVPETISEPQIQGVVEGLSVGDITADQALPAIEQVPVGVERAGETENNKEQIIDEESRNREIYVIPLAEEVNETKDTEQKTIGSLDATASNENTETIRFLEDHNWEAKPMEEEIGTSSGKPVEVTSSVSEEENIAVLGACNEKTDTAPTLVMEDISSREIHPDDKYLKPYDLSSETENPETTETSPQGKEVDSVMLEETSGMVSQLPTIKHENADKKSEKLKNSDVVEEDGIEVEEPKSSDPVSENKELQSGTSLIVGTTDTDEIKEEIKEVPETISEPPTQGVVEAVTVGDTMPDQTLPAIEQVPVGVERADETENITEQIIDQESRNKELYVIPMADEEVNKVKDTEQEPIGSLETTDSNENTETIRFLEDLNWEAKPLEEEIGISSGKPMEDTSSVSEEENVAVVGNCNEKTDTTPTLVMEDVRSREVHPDDESLKPFDASSEMENPETTETSRQGKEVDSVMLEETSGMVSQLPTIKHENADKKSEKLKNSDADEEDDNEVEEPKCSDLVSETKDLQSGTSQIVGTTNTDEIKEEIKEVPETISEPPIQGVVEAVTVGDTTPDQTLPAIEQVPVGVERADETENVTEQIIDEEIHNKELYVIPMPDEEVNEMKDTEQEPIGSLEATDSNENTETKRFLKDFNWEAKPLEEEIVTSSAKPVEVTSSVSEEENIEVDGDCSEKTDTAPTLVMEDVSSREVRPDNESLKPFDASSETENPETTETSPQGKEVDSVMLEETSGMVSQLPTIKHENADTNSEKLKNSDADEEDDNEVEEPKSSDLVSETKDLQSGTSLIVGTTDTDEIKEEIKDVPETITEPPIQGVVEAVTVGDTTPDQTLPAIEQVPVGVERADETENVKEQIIDEESRKRELYEILMADEEVNEVKDTEQEPIGSLEPTNSNENTETKRFLEDLNWEAKPLEEEIGTSSRNPVEVTSSVSEEENVAVVGDCNEKTDSAPTLVMEDVRSREVHPDDESLKPFDASSETEKPETTETSPQGKGVESVMLEETSGMVSPLPPIKHENADKKSEKLKNSDADEEDDNEVEEPKSSALVSETKDLQRGTSLIVGTTDADEIKEEIKEVPETITEPPIQGVVEAVTVGDTTPYQTLPAIEPVPVGVERADETENVKEQITDEEGRNKELYVIPMADEEVNEVKETEQEPIGSLEATDSNENTETIRFLEDLNWEAKPLEEENGTSSGKPMEVTSSVSEEVNVAVVGDCNENTDSAPTLVMEDVRSREVHPDDESLKPFDASSETENPETTETSPQGKGVDSVMLEETSGMVSQLPTIKHENADTNSEKLKNSDADEEDDNEVEEPKSSDLVSETKDLQSGTSLIVGTTDTDEIKEEIKEVPETITEPPIQGVVEAVTVGDTTPYQTLPAIEQVPGGVERADETENVKQQIIDEESRNKELYVIPMADEEVNEVKETEQEPIGSLEATDSNENTETIRFLEDLNWEAKPLEGKIGTSTGKPVEVTSLVSEEENVAVVGDCNERTDTAPTLVMEDVRSREVQPDDESLKPFDASSETENPETTETSPQGKEVDSVMLGETSGMVSQLPPIKHENADKKSEKLKNSDADEEDDNEVEEPKSSDLVSETKNLFSGTSLIVGTIDTDEIKEEIKEVPETISEPQIQGVVQAVTVGDTTPAQTLTAIEQVPVRVERADESESVTEQIIDEESRNKELYVIPMADEEVNELKDTEQEPIGSLEATDSNENTETIRFLEDFNWEVKPLEEEIGTSSGKPVEVTSSVSEEENIAVVGDCNEKTDTAPTLVLEDVRSKEVHPDDESLKPFDASSETENPETTETSPQGKEVDSVMLEETSGMVSQLATIKHESADKKSEKLKNSDADEEDDNEVEEPKCSDLVSETKDLQSGTSQRVGTTDADEIKEEIKEVPETITEPPVQGVVEAVTDGDTTPYQTLPAIEQVPEGVERADETENVKEQITDEESRNKEIYVIPMADKEVNEVKETEQEPIGSPEAMDSNENTETIRFLEDLNWEAKPLEEEIGTSSGKPVEVTSSVSEDVNVAVVGDCNEKTDTAPTLVMEVVRSREVHPDDDSLKPFDASSEMENPETTETSPQGKEVDSVMLEETSGMVSQLPTIKHENADKKNEKLKNSDADEEDDNEVEEPKSSDLVSETKNLFSGTSLIVGTTNTDEIKEEIKEVPETISEPQIQGVVQAVTVGDTTPDQTLPAIEQVPVGVERADETENVEQINDEESRNKELYVIPMADEKVNEVKDTEQEPIGSAEATDSNENTQMISFLEDLNWEAKPLEEEIGTSSGKPVEVTSSVSEEENIAVVGDCNEKTDTAPTLVMDYVRSREVHPDDESLKPFDPSSETENAEITETGPQGKEVDSVMLEETSGLVCQLPTIKHGNADKKSEKLKNSDADEEDGIKLEEPKSSHLVSDTKEVQSGTNLIVGTTDTDEIEEEIKEVPETISEPQIQGVVEGVTVGDITPDQAFPAIEPVPVGVERAGETENIKEQIIDEESRNKELYVKPMPDEDDSEVKYTEQQPIGSVEATYSNEKTETIRFLEDHNWEAKPLEEEIRTSIGKPVEVTSSVSEEENIAIVGDCNEKTDTAPSLVMEDVSSREVHPYNKSLKRFDPSSQTENPETTETSPQGKEVDSVMLEETSGMVSQLPTIKHENADKKSEKLKNSDAFEEDDIEVEEPKSSDLVSETKDLQSGTILIVRTTDTDEIKEEIKEVPETISEPHIQGVVEAVTVGDITLDQALPAIEQVNVPELEPIESLKAKASNEDAETARLKVVEDLNWEAEALEEEMETSSKKPGDVTRSVSEESIEVAGDCNEKSNTAPILAMEDASSQKVHPDDKFLKDFDTSSESKNPETTESGPQGEEVDRMRPEQISAMVSQPAPIQHANTDTKSEKSKNSDADEEDDVEEPKTSNLISETKDLQSGTSLTVGTTDTDETKEELKEVPETISECQIQSVVEGVTVGDITLDQTIPAIEQVPVGVERDDETENIKEQNIDENSQNKELYVIPLADKEVNEVKDTEQETIGSLEATDSNENTETIRFLEDLDWEAKSLEEEIGTSIGKPVEVTSSEEENIAVVGDCNEKTDSAPTQVMEDVRSREVHPDDDSLKPFDPSSETENPETTETSPQGKEVDSVMLEETSGMVSQLPTIKHENADKKNEKLKNSDADEEDDNEVEEPKCSDLVSETKDLQSGMSLIVGTTDTDEIKEEMKEVPETISEPQIQGVVEAVTVGDITPDQTLPAIEQVPVGVERADETENVKEQITDEESCNMELYIIPMAYEVNEVNDSEQEAIESLEATYSNEGTKTIRLKVVDDLNWEAEIMEEEMKTASKKLVDAARSVLEEENIAVGSDCNEKTNTAPTLVMEDVSSLEVHPDKSSKAFDTNSDTDNPETTETSPQGEEVYSVMLEETSGMVSQLQKIEHEIADKKSENFKKSDPDEIEVEETKTSDTVSKTRDQGVEETLERGTIGTPDTDEIKEVPETISEPQHQVVEATTNGETAPNQTHPAIEQVPAAVEGAFKTENIKQQIIDEENHNKELPLISIADETVNEVKEPDLEPIESLEASTLIEALEKELKKSRKEPVDLTNSISGVSDRSEEENIELAGDCIEKIDIAPTVLMEDISSQEVQRDDKSLKASDASSNTKSRGTTKTVEISTRDEEVDSVKLEETSGMVSQFPTIEHENEDKKRKHFKKSDAGEDEIEVEETRTSDPVSKTKDQRVEEILQSGAMLTVGTTDPDEIKEVPEKIFEVQDVDAVTDSEIAPDQTLPAIKQVHVRVEIADETENIKQIIDEESHNKELPVISIADETVNEVKDPDLEPVESLEATDSNEDTEIVGLKVAKDLNWEAEAYPLTTSQKEMEKGRKVAVDVTSSVSEVSEEENIEVASYCNEKTETAPTVVKNLNLEPIRSLEATGSDEDTERMRLEVAEDLNWEAEASLPTKALEEEMKIASEKPVDVTSSVPKVSEENIELAGDCNEKVNIAPTVVVKDKSSWEVQQDDKSLKASDTSSNNKSLGTTKTEISTRGEEVDSVKLEKTLSMASRFPTIEHENADKSENLKNSDADGDEIEVEETKTSDLVSKTEDQSVEEILQSGTTLTVGTNDTDKIKEVPVKISEPQDQGVESATNGEIAPDQTLPAIKQMKETDLQPIESLEATNSNDDTETVGLKVAEDLKREVEASPLTTASEEEMEKVSKKPVDITSSVSEVSQEENIAVTVADGEVTPDQSLPAERLEEQFQAPSSPSLFDSMITIKKNEDEGTKNTETELHSMKLEQTSGIVSQIPTTERDNADDMSLSVEKLDADEIEEDGTKTFDAVCESKYQGVEDINESNVQKTDTDRVEKDTPGTIFELRHQEVEAVFNSEITLDQSLPVGKSEQQLELQTSALLSKEQDHEIMATINKTEDEGTDKDEAEVHKMKLDKTSGIVSELPTIEHDNADNVSVIVENEIGVEEIKTSDAVRESKELAAEEIHETEISLTVGKTETHKMEEEIKEVLEVISAPKYQSVEAVIDGEITLNQTHPTEILEEQLQVQSSALLLREQNHRTATITEKKEDESTNNKEAEFDSMKLKEISGMVSQNQTIEQSNADDMSVTLEKLDEVEVEEIKNFDAVCESKDQGVVDFHESGANPTVGKTNADKIVKEIEETPETIIESRYQDVETFTDGKITIDQGLPAEKSEQHEVSTFALLSKKRVHETLSTAEKKEDESKNSNETEVYSMKLEENSGIPSQLLSAIVEHEVVDEEIRTSEAESNSKNLVAEEIHETETSLTVRKTNTDKTEDVIKEVLKEISEPKNLVVEVVTDGEITLDQTFPARKLEEQLQVPSSALLSKEQDHETTIITERMKDDSSKRGETEVDSVKLEKTSGKITSSQLPTNEREDADDVSETLATDEAKRNRTSDIVHESKDQGIEEIHETVTSPTMAKTDRDKMEEEIRGAPETIISKPRYQGAEEITDGKITSSQTLPAGILEEQLQVPSSSLLSREQDHETTISTEKIEDGRAKFDSIKFEETSGMVSQLSTTEQTVEKLDADKVAETKTSDTVCELKDWDAKEIQETRTGATEEKTDADKMEEEMKKIPEIISEPRDHGVETDTSGEITPDQTQAARLLEKQLQVPSNALLSKEQDHETMTKIEKKENENTNKVDIQGNENLFATSTREETCPQKEDPRELKVSKIELKLIEDIQENSPHETSEEKRTKHEEDSDIKPQAYVSETTYPCSESECEKRAIQCSLLGISIDENVLDSGNSVEDVDNLPRPHSKFKETLPGKVGEKTGNALASASEVHIPEVLDKAEEKKIKEEQIEADITELGAKENQNEGISETVKSKISSEKITEEKDDAKKSHLVSFDKETIAKSNQEDELRAEKYPRKKLNETIKINRDQIPKEEYFEEIEKAGAYENIEETITGNNRAEDTSQVSSADGKIIEKFLEEANDGKNVKKEPFELDLENWVDVANCGATATEAMALSKEVRSSEVISIKHEDNKKDANDKETVIRKDDKVQELNVSPVLDGVVEKAPDKNVGEKIEVSEPTPEEPIQEIFEKYEGNKEIASANSNNSESLIDDEKLKQTSPKSEGKVSDAIQSLNLKEQEVCANQPSTSPLTETLQKEEADKEGEDIVQKKRHDFIFDKKKMDEVNRSEENSIKIEEEHRKDEEPVDPSSIKKIEDESTNKEDTRMNENLDDSFAMSTIEETCLQKEKTRELEDIEDSPNKASKEESIDLEEVSAIEPQEYVSAIQYADSPSESEKRPIHSSVRVTSKYEAVLDSGSSIKEVENLLNKPEETKIEEQHLEAAMTELRAKENINDRIFEANETTENEISSGKILELTDVPKVINLVSPDEETITKGNQEDELRAEEYPKEKINETTEITKNNEKLFKEMDKAGEYKNIEETTVGDDRAVKDTSQVLDGKGTIMEYLLQIAKEGNNASDSENQGDEVNFGDTATEAMALSEKASSSELVFVKHEENRKGDNDMETVIRKDEEVQELKVPPVTNAMDEGPPEKIEEVSEPTPKEPIQEIIERCEDNKKIAFAVRYNSECLMDDEKLKQKSPILACKGNDVIQGLNMKEQEVSSTQLDISSVLQEPVELSTIEKIEVESTTKDDIQLNENLKATSTIEDTCLQMSKMELKLIKDTWEDSPNEVSREESAALEEISAIEPQEYASEMKYADSPSECEKRLIHSSLLLTSKDEDVLDSGNSIKKVDDLPSLHSTVKESLPGEVGDNCNKASILEFKKTAKVLESASDVHSPEVLNKPDEIKLNEEQHEASVTELKDEENQSGEISESNETRETAILSEKIVEEKDVAKDLMSPDEETIKKSNHEDELRAEEYQREKANEIIGITKKKEELFKEIDKVGAYKDIEETTTHDDRAVVKDTSHVLVGDETIIENILEESKDVKKAPLELDVENQGDEANSGERATEVMALSEEVSSSEVVLVKNKENRKGADDKETVIRKDSVVEEALDKIFREKFKEVSEPSSEEPNYDIIETYEENKEISLGNNTDSECLTYDEKLKHTSTKSACEGSDAIQGLNMKEQEVCANEPSNSSLSETSQKEAADKERENKVHEKQQSFMVNKQKTDEMTISEWRKSTKFEGEHRKEEEQVQVSTRGNEKKLDGAEIHSKENVSADIKDSDMWLSQKDDTVDPAKGNKINRDIQEQEKTIFSISNELIPRESDPNRSTETIISTGSKDIPLVQKDQTGKKFQNTEVEDLKAESDYWDGPEMKGIECGEEKRMGYECEETTENIASIESTKISLSSLQGSTIEASQMAKHLTEERELMVNKEDLQTEKAETAQVEEAKTYEEKDEEEEGDEHKRAGSDSDAPVIVEASRDMDVKIAHKKSHNILSGVRSKVKHSIAKVKKVISCNSSQFLSHPEPPSPK